MHKTWALCRERSTTAMYTWEIQPRLSYQIKLISSYKEKPLFSHLSVNHHELSTITLYRFPLKKFYFIVGDFGASHREFLFVSGWSLDCFARPHDYVIIYSQIVGFFVHAHLTANQLSTQTTSKPVHPQLSLTYKISPHIQLETFAHNIEYKSIFI